MQTFIRTARQKAPGTCQNSPKLKKLIRILKEYHNQASNPVYRFAINKLNGAIGNICGSCTETSNLFHSLIDPYVDFLMRPQHPPEVSVSLYPQGNPNIMPVQHTSRTFFRTGRALLNHLMNSREIDLIIDSESDLTIASELSRDVRVLRVFSDSIPDGALLSRIRDEHSRTGMKDHSYNSDFKDTLEHLVKSLHLAHILNSDKSSMADKVGALTDLLELFRGQFYSKHDLNPDALFRVPPVMEDTRLHKFFLERAEKLAENQEPHITSGEKYILSTLRSWIDFEEQRKN